ncbi:MAG: phosphoenolpyruvate synthase [Bacteroidetes bacterium 4572_112]|nr:MAG: phosphoenolpyruvate synthase [Bacteroidetes bacterium 4572_112]
MAIQSNSYFYNTDVEFGQLMSKRINKVLLICSEYDAFMLEEDGRIDEQIFNEYVALNLRYPPQFIQVSTADAVFFTMEDQQIDLVINMLSVDGMDPFELSNKIKDKYEHTPIVALTPFSREISKRLENEDLHAFEYVFSWLGNSDILLAIVKLIEDAMNVEYDVNQVGVPVVILVEDSVRFYSSYLPNMYKIIFNQSKKYMSEGLNEHQKTMRMRGRPKIVLATDYDKALEYFERYKNNLLGVVSDMSYKREGVRDIHAGLKLGEIIRAEDAFMPFLLQSSDPDNRKYAEKLEVDFIDKNSKSLNKELRHYIVNNFAFGDFEFYCPREKKVIGRAHDLQSLQRLIMEVPDEVLEYHINRNDVSKWLKSRALYHIANMFKFMRAEHFNGIDQVRKFIYDALADYRQNTSRGVIAKFYRKSFDKYVMFARIGEGSIGGKARGLAFIDILLKQHKMHQKYPGVFITIPKTVVISTDIFDEFMESNNLYEIALSDSTDEEILAAFVRASLPITLIQDLEKYIDIIKKPIAIRSSSLLEDSHYQPFAGIYSTMMLPLVDSKSKNLKKLSEAIKNVYSSVYFKASKAYMSATKNVIDEEKMALVLQEVCGQEYGDVFMPSFSGVTRSVNFYPIGSEKPEDGVVEIALGLGKQIVDGGGNNLRFSPRSPQKVLQLSTPGLALTTTQKKFFALDLNQQEFVPSVSETVNLKHLSTRNLPNHPSMRMMLSSYDLHDKRIRDSWDEKSKKIVTFSHILKYGKMPLTDIITDVLTLGQKAMNKPVEIEFAVNLNKNDAGEYTFSLLQIRPIVESTMSQKVEVEDVDIKKTIIYSDSSLGNGIYHDIQDILYVKPQTFESKNNILLPALIEKINEKFMPEDKHYILVGPGRWGSSDRWLGIPVMWPQISQSRIIVESGLSNYRIDPSQGTHFFQNLTSFGVGYLTVNPHIKQGYTNYDYLDSLPAVYEDEYLRLVHFENELDIRLDGKNTKAVVYIPGEG